MSLGSASPIWNLECVSRKPKVRGEGGSIESGEVQELLRAPQQLGSVGLARSQRSLSQYGREVALAVHWKALREPWGANLKVELLTVSASVPASGFLSGVPPPDCPSWWTTRCEVE